MVTLEEAKLAVEALASALEARGAPELRFERVSDAPHEKQRFAATDRASLAEMYHGELLDPAAAGDGDGPEALEDPFAFGRCCYWLRLGEERVGTIALRDLPYRLSVSAEISSLYIRREHRRRGLARRALGAVREHARAAGVRTVMLSTSWLAQPAVRLYLSSGMWVRSWKRDLELELDTQKAEDWKLEQDAEDRCRFVVGGRTLISATRHGDRLGWTVHDAGTSDQVVVEATFSVALASMGWPLIRDEARWRERLGRGHGDIGGPEDFACYCRHQQAYALHCGRRVAVPAIPGVDYPDWIALHGPRFCPQALEKLLQGELSALEQGLLLQLAKCGTWRCDPRLAEAPTTMSWLAEQLGTTVESIRQALARLQAVYQASAGQSFLTVESDTAHIPNFLAADQVYCALRA